jgi:hypothetical protein
MAAHGDNFLSLGSGVAFQRSYSSTEGEARRAYDSRVRAAFTCRSRFADTLAQGSAQNRCRCGNYR